MKTIINFRTIEEFKTTRLYAKKVCEDDFTLVLPLYQDKAVMETLGGVVSEVEAKERFSISLAGWENNGFDAWLWFEKKSNFLVGRAGLRVLEIEGERVIEVGYVLSSKFWNKGFATEMASASIEIAFEVLNLREIVCFTSVTNKPSQRVMEKVGFKYDRNFIYLNEEHVLYRYPNPLRPPMTKKPIIDPEERMKRVELSEYNSAWPKDYARAAAEIKEILQDKCIAIHHMGSTAIPNIYAKPIIDLLVVVKDLNEIDNFNPSFEKLSYICMGEYGMAGRRFYWRSKTLRTHNVHLFSKDDPEIARHLKFKNFMNAHPEYAQAYSIIKQSLAKVFADDIENYVNGKASFVQMVDYKTGTARAEQLSAKDNIIIKPYNHAWPKLAEAEMAAIKTCISLPYVAIEHR